MAEGRVDKEGANETNNKTSSNMTHDAEKYDEQENGTNKVTSKLVSKSTSEARNQEDNQAGNKTTRTIIKISDSGPGVVPGEEMKIFKPFFEGSNTKKNSGGIGVGLSIVWMIAKSLGANIKAYNKHTGKGLVIETSF